MTEPSIILDVIQNRRSVRHYQEKELPREALLQMVDAARYAPTARAVEPWEFVVVTRPETLVKIAGITDHGKFIAQARACILVYCQDTKYYLEDGCAATQNILLMAAAMGVGSCWVAGDKKPYGAALSELLGVPSSCRLISLISLGYPKAADGFKVANRKGVKDIVHWERY